MKKLSLLAAALVVATSACTKASVPTAEGMPDIGLPAEALNTQIRVWSPDGKVLKINMPISLAVQVVGSEEVIFPRDFGNRMFRYTDEGWVEVENVPTDWGEGFFLLSPSNGGPGDWTSTRVFPWFEQTDEPILLRVFVEGKVYRQDEMTDDPVGGYVDVTLKR